MNLENKTVLITGANRGIGRALVNEALGRGAKRIYAGTRRSLQHADRRVTPLTLDVTNVSQIQRAVDEVDTLDVLINNAGVAFYDDLTKLDAIEQHLTVNLLGSLKVTHAFLPLLRSSKGAIVNNLSLAALAPLQPGAELTVTLKSAEPGDGLDEGFLGNFLGILRMKNHPQSDVVNPCPSTFSSKGFLSR